MDIDKKKTRKKVLPPLRVSDAEDSQIRKRAKAAGLSLSEYQRRACSNAIVKVTNAGLKVNVAVFRELNAIGNNLNQLVRNAHIHDECDHKRLHHVLDLLESAILKIAEDG